MDSWNLWMPINANFPARNRHFHIIFQENNVGACDFKTRLFCIRREIIGPRKEAMQRGIIRRENEPISVRVKVLIFSCGIQSVQVSTYIKVSV